MPAKREKEFNTACQEEVYRQVKSYLDELVDEHFDDAEHCDFYLKYGSTVLEISIDPYQEDDAVIEVLAFCVQGVEPSFELMQELLARQLRSSPRRVQHGRRETFSSRTPSSAAASVPSNSSHRSTSWRTFPTNTTKSSWRSYGGETAIDCLRSGGMRPRSSSPRERRTVIEVRAAYRLLFNSDMDATGQRQSRF